MKNDMYEIGDVIDIAGKKYEVVENTTEQFTCNLCREVNKCTACPLEILQEITGQRVANDCVDLLPARHYIKEKP